ncbi:MAG: hypothetical protein FJZ56_04435 [Chlamydiae bacterium]|nr:hypothetical protein [Chlamydiota bacterium]
MITTKFDPTQPLHKRFDLALEVITSGRMLCIRSNRNIPVEILSESEAELFVRRNYQNRVEALIHANIVFDLSERLINRALPLVEDHCKYVFEDLTGNFHPIKDDEELSDLDQMIKEYIHTALPVVSTNHFALIDRRTNTELTDVKEGRLYYLQSLEEDHAIDHEFYQSFLETHGSQILKKFRLQDRIDKDGFFDLKDLPFIIDLKERFYISKDAMFISLDVEPEDEILRTYQSMYEMLITTRKLTFHANRSAVLGKVTTADKNEFNVKNYRSSGDASRHKNDLLAITAKYLQVVVESNPHNGDWYFKDLRGNIVPFYFVEDFENAIKECINRVRSVTNITAKKEEEHVLVDRASSTEIFTVDSSRRYAFCLSSDSTQETLEDKPYEILRKMVTLSLPEEL